MTDTIFALSSGAPPAAIAIVRVSGEGAFSAVASLIDEELPDARHAGLRTLRQGELILDSALVLRFPGPTSATGENLVELHLHGGRATVAAVFNALGTIDGLRMAEPGEFTRRAFENGRIDLSAAEGLSDLLRAETEGQRRAAMNIASGGLSAVVEEFRGELVDASARVEAAIEFADEDDVLPWPERGVVLKNLAERIGETLANPPAERLHDGVRVVVAGPPNAGKSSLINRLVAREVAIVSEVAGTTRDVIEVPVHVQGVPLVYIDSAGVRDCPDNAIEAAGIARALRQIEAADIVVWLGAAHLQPDRANVHCVRAKSDLAEADDGRLACSALTGDNVAALAQRIIEEAGSLLPQTGGLILNQRQRSCLIALRQECLLAAQSTDLLICAEHLRLGRLELDRLVGRSQVEHLLDALFGTFCIGK